MSDFDSLTWALEGWFDTSLRDLPDAQRKRVKRDFPPMPLDSLSADERRSVALQLDYQHDPATERERQQAWDRHVRMDEIRIKIADWKQVATPIASDLSIKESRLARLQEELSQLESEERIARRNKSVPSTGHVAPTKPPGDTKYLPYLVALRHLTERIGATPEELAGWVWSGPVEGGRSQKEKPGNCRSRTIRPSRMLRRQASHTLSPTSRPPSSRWKPSSRMTRTSRRTRTLQG